MKNPDSFHVLTMDKACEYLQVSRPTLLKLIQQNEIKARKVGRCWRLLRENLDNYLNPPSFEDQ